MNTEQFELVKKACDIATKNERDIKLIIQEMNGLKARENNKVIATPQASIQTIKELRIEFGKELAPFEMDFVKTHLLSIIEKFHIVKIEYR